MKLLRSMIASVCWLFAVVSVIHAQALDPVLQSKVDEQIKVVAKWAAEPVVVEAVRAHNAAVPAEHAALDQEKWRSLTVLDPVVRSLTKNAVGQFLKTKKSDLVTEAFVSDAQGLKVGFVAKPTTWSHKGKPKHDVPMTGKSWRGPVEIDESSGLQQIQISVPVMDSGKPIGSMVVGISVGTLAR